MRKRAVLAAAAILALLAFLLARSCAAPAPAPPPRPVAPTVAPAVAAVPEPAPERRASPTAPVPAVPEVPDPGGAPLAPLRIHGRVLDPDGAGVAAARIELRAWAWSTKMTTVVGATKQDGSFEFRIEREQASNGFGLETAAEGFLEGWVAVKPGEYDEGPGIDVRVERGRAVAGRIVDEYGRGIAGSAVGLWYGSETTWPTTVDQSGAFRTPAKGPRRAFELIVEAPGYPRRTVPLPAAEEEVTDVGAIAFRRGGRVAGIVVDAQDRPLADLPLELTGIVGYGAIPRARTDGTGRFEFTDVGEGIVSVAVDERSGEARRYRGGSGDVQVGRTDVRVVARRETNVLLRFVDAAGQPVSVMRADYGLRAEGTPVPERLGLGVAAPEGVSSTLLGAWPGRYDVTVRSPGFEDAHVHGVEVPDAPEATIDVPMRRKP